MSSAIVGQSARGLTIFLTADQILNLIGPVYDIAAITNHGNDQQKGGIEGGNERPEDSGKVDPCTGAEY